MAQCNMRFPLEVGALLRGQVRYALDKMKNDLRWRSPDTTVIINESKGFLESTFYVEVLDIDENYAYDIKRSIEGWMQ